MNDTPLRSVYETDDYGEIVINVDNLLKEKAPNVTKNKLSTLLGTDFDLVARYSKNTVIRVNLDILARFCYVFDCSIEDILKYRSPIKK